MGPSQCRPRFVRPLSLRLRLRQSRLPRFRHHTPGISKQRHPPTRSFLGLLPRPYSLDLLSIPPSDHPRNHLRPATLLRQLPRPPSLLFPSSLRFLGRPPRAGLPSSHLPHDQARPPRPLPPPACTSRAGERRRKLSVRYRLCQLHESREDGQRAGGEPGRGRRPRCLV